MKQKIRCKLLATLTAILAWSAAIAATPGMPVLTATFELEPPRGRICGTVTAPLTDTSQEPLPDNCRIDITVSRSCYGQGQNNLVIAKFSGLKPGESAEYVDNLTPVWEYNQQYVYTADVVCAPYSFHTGYASMTPGLAFNFEANAFTVTPLAQDNEVNLKAVTPYRDIDGVALTVPILAMEFYRAVDMSSWPYRYALIHSETSPEPKSTVEFTDKGAEPDKINYYKVRAVTPYGFAEAMGQCYVGADIPAAPYPVEAALTAGGVLVSWTAPDRGENWGAIDPSQIWYNVYRCRGYGDSNRELIASRITETSFLDTGDGLEAPLAVRYQVEAGNQKGTGGSNYSSYDYDILVGPAYGLPFADTFDGGFNKVWSLEASSYYARWYEATEGEYGSRPVTVRPVQGNGLVYVDYVYNSPSSGSVNSMTSYKIDLSDATNPWISFWYYAIPDNDVSITFSYSEDPENFPAGETISIAKDVTEPEWRQVRFTMKDVAGSAAAYVRISTTFLDKPSSAIIDDLLVIDYPLVTDLKCKPDPEKMSATLTWSVPTEGKAPCTGFIGYVDGEEKGDVTSPWVLEDLEYDRSYSISVRPLYDGVVAAASQPVTVQLTAPAPTEFTAGDYFYKVVADEIATEEMHKVVVAGYSGRGGLVRMPDEVTFNNVAYDVIGIAAAAFEDNGNIESISIPEGIGFIEERAFRNATSLEAVSIPASVATIGKESFAGCGSLMMVNFAGTEPPSVDTDAFLGVAEGCKGHCPAGSEKAYAGVENLKPLNFGVSGAVWQIDAAMDEVEYFDMAGSRIDSPEAGRPCLMRVRLASGEVRTLKVIVPPTK